MVASFVFGATVNQLASEEHPILAESISNDEPVLRKSEHEGQATAPEPFDDLGAAIQHGPASPCRQPIVAPFELELCRDVPSDDCGAIGGELMAVVFDDPDFDLTLAN
jgi:hypothetical protein